MIAHSLILHTRVLEAFYSFLVHVYNILYFLVLPIKYLIKQYGNTNMPFKLVTGPRPLVSHLRVLYFPCVVQRATAHIGTKASNMCHKAQTRFCSIFVGITQHLKRYLVYIPGKRKIIS